MSPILKDKNNLSFVVLCFSVYCEKVELWEQRKVNFGKSYQVRVSSFKFSVKLFQNGPILVDCKYCKGLF